MTYIEIEDGTSYFSEIAQSIIIHDTLILPDERLQQLALLRKQAQDIGDLCGMYRIDHIVTLSETYRSMKAAAENAAKYQQTVSARKTK